MTCANCRAPAFVRIGRQIGGVGWREHDYCEACAQGISSAIAGAVASLALPSPTYGPPGQAIHARSVAADRDDRAAMRGVCS